MHKIYTYVKRQKKEWKLLTISMVTDKYKGFPLEAEQTNKKLVMCFASICLKYCIYMKFSTLLWLHVKLKVIFLVLFFFLWQLDEMILTSLPRQESMYFLQKENTYAWRIRVDIFLTNKSIERLAI